jgi:hypothetical protein
MDHDGTTMATDTTSGVCIPKMDMSLHWGTCEWILVRTWKADTTGKFWLAAVLIFLSAIAYEGLKYYRELLFYKVKQNATKFIKQSDGSVVRREEKMTIKVSCRKIINFYLAFNSFRFPFLGATSKYSSWPANSASRNSNLHLIHSHVDHHVVQYVPDYRCVLGCCHWLLFLRMVTQDDSKRLVRVLLLKIIYPCIYSILCHI